MKILALIPIILGIISVSQNIRHASVGATMLVASAVIFISVLLWGIALSKKAIENRAKRIAEKKSEKMTG